MVAVSFWTYLGVGEVGAHGRVAVFVKVLQQRNRHEGARLVERPEARDHVVEAAGAHLPGRREEVRGLLS